MEQIYFQKNRYRNGLPYYLEGKLRKDHFSRIIIESSLFKKHLKKYSLSNPRVLDLGCHDGRILKMITVGYNAQLSGVDITKSITDKAKLNGINASVRDINRGINFRAKSFDFVIAGEIIEHLYDPRLVLREINRTLDSNGGVIITVPNICSFRNRIKILFGKLPHHYNSSLQEKWGDHIRLFTSKSMTYLLKKSGFKVSSVRSNGLFGISFLANFFPKLGDILVFYAIKNKSA